MERNVPPSNTVSNNAAPDQLAGRESKILNPAEYEAHGRVWGAFEHLACMEVVGLPPILAQAALQARRVLDEAIRQEGWDGPVELEVSISDEMAARICQWHMKLMPHLLARDDNDDCVVVPFNVQRYNYSPELSALLNEIYADLGGWLQSLDVEDGDFACIYFHPSGATVMVGDVDIELALEAA